jgi:hypothetical protein
MNHVFLFGEFISSNNFLLLLLEKLNLLSPRLGMGIYFQGLPIQNIVDFVWGTSAGIRPLPVLFYLTLLQKIFGNHSETIYLLIVLLSPFFSFLYAFRKYKKINSLVILSALFFAFNPWIIDRLFSGFWQLNIAYALLPFTITLPRALIENNQKNEILITSAKLSIISSLIIYLQPHFLLMASVYWISYLAYIIYKKNYLKVKLLIKLFLITSVFIFLINSFFILPGLLFKEMPFTSPGQYFSLAAVQLNGEGAQIQNLLRFDPLLYKETLPPLNIEQISQYFFIITLALVIFLNKRRKEWILIFSFLIFLFLAKGINEPFVGLSKFIYENFPPMHFFRDPPRFTAALALYACLIIAFHSYLINKKTRNILLLLGIVIVIVSNQAFLFKNRYDLYRPSTIPTAYLQSQNFLDLQPKETRLLTIPDSPGISNYPMYTGNPLPSSINIFDMVLPLNLELVNGTGYPDNYSNQLVSFLSNEYILQNYDSKILAPFSTNLILFDSSIKNSPIYNISSASGKIIFKKDNISILKNELLSKKVSTKKPIYLIGDFKSIEKLYKEGNNSPVILLNQSINAEKDFKKVGIHNVYYDLPNGPDTLVYERLKSRYSLHILKSIWNNNYGFSNCEPYKKNYILNFGNLFTSGECVESGYNVDPTKVKINIPQNNYLIAIKAMTTSSAPLDIGIGDKNIHADIDTKGKLKWITLGKYDLKNDGVILKVKNKEKIVIDSFVIIPTEVFKKEQESLSSSIELIPLNRLKVDKSKDNTHYNQAVDSVSVSKPSKYLTYRFSYGGYWKSDKPSQLFISDGYAMTFIADSDIAKIQYYPNFIYRISLVISALSLICVLMLVFFKERLVGGFLVFYKYVVESFRRIFPINSFFKKTVKKRRPS